MNHVTDEMSPVVIWGFPADAQTYLRGVLGLPTIRRGERTFGSNENLSLMLSRTDGATYVKPCRNKRDQRHTVTPHTERHASTLKSDLNSTRLLLILMMCAAL